MNEILLVLGMIVVFFIFFLIFKEFLPLKYKENVCVLCFSISATWIFLLIFNYLEYFQNKIIIALLMGQSILGVFYIVEKRIRNDLKLFLLPFLLTLSGIGYISLDGFLKEILLFLLGLWVLFIFVYFFRKIKGVCFIVSRITACCRNW